MATTTPTTAADLLAMPDDGWRYELIEGVLHRMSPAGFEHGEIGSTFVRHLGNFVVPRDLGRVVTGETGFFLSRDPETVVAPDAAFVRADRLPPRAERRGYLDLVPDLVVEVVSPNDRPTEVEDKVARYLAAGARLVWVTYPRRRLVRVHAPGRAPQDLSEGDALDGEDVLPGFRLPVDDIFR
jgi:Uma2 family endonuclease